MNYLPKFEGKNNWSWLKVVGVIIVLAAIIILIVFLGRKNNVSESFMDSSEEAEDLKENFTSESEDVDENTNTNGAMDNTSMTKLAPQASEPLGDNEIFKPIDNGNDNDPTGLQGNQLPKDCYPKDQLTPSELLPGDPNTKWAQVNPAGQGDLKDQNFLNAGHHLGVNTVGQSLRNSNLQLRSEPPNPQVKVSPWMQTTIEPDTNRRPMEIGGCE